MWRGANYTGEKLTIRRIGVSNKIYNKMNDDVSSVKNHRKKTSVLFVDINGSGNTLCLDPGDKIPDLTTEAFNNVASSSSLSRSIGCL